MKFFRSLAKVLTNIKIFDCWCIIVRIINKHYKNKKMADKNNVYKDYEKIADWFDKHRSRNFFEKPYLDKVISYFKPHAKILDLGCGMGEPIAQYFIEQGFDLIGIDGSSKLIALAQKRFSKATWIVEDIRDVVLSKKFDCVVVWHSLFHLSAEDQRKMFQVFTNHLNQHGMLLFTSGHEAGEVWSDNGGENLYHASLSADEYKTLLQQYGFELLLHVVQDPACGGATVWMARLNL